MDKINAVVEWARANGAHISTDIQFAAFGEANFGAISSSGSSSIKIPVDLLVKLSDAVAGLGLEKEAGPVAELLKKPSNINAFLKMFLAREKAEGSSKFKTYIDSLPSSVEINSPYVWSPEDVKCLKGTNLGSSLRENLLFLVEEWWSVVNLLPEALAKPEGHFLNMKFYYEHKFYDEAQLHEYLVGESPANWTSFPAYLWASMILKSRSFPSGLLRNGDVSEFDTLQDDVATLIPVIDLLNHSPRAEVTWAVSDGFFSFESSQNSQEQLFNNYGRKGNEELLLAYGFCLEDNSADSVALKIKVPVPMLPELEAAGITLPSISDYTTSVVPQKEPGNAYKQHEDGLLFFITKEHIPADLIRVFQWLVRSKWESSGISVRMQLSGLNHLRQALESKAALVDLGSVGGSKNGEVARIYLAGQKKILSAAVARVKKLEKELLAEHKSRILTLKGVYKKDTRFARSLLVTMGVASYEDILEQGYSDQVWLLYLIRCYNKREYSKEDPEEQFLPDWLQQAFEKMDAETAMDAAEVVQFQGLYEGLVIPMNQAVPEIYNVGKWTVREMIVSTKLLDTVGFVRGKQQECMLVQPA